MTRWIAARLHHSLARVALLWFPLLLAACSGEPAGDPAVWRDAEQLSRPGQLPSTGTGPTQRRALNVPRRNVQALTAAALFDWAERTYPALFPPSAPMKTWDRYTYRYYAGSGNYLAVAGDSVYALGGFTQQQILRVGTLEDFHCDVLPADCVPPALSLVPSSLSGTYLRGSAPVFPVVATATDLAAFTGDTLFVYVVDSQHVLSSGISLRSLGNGQFRAEVQPAASLAPGRYQGTLLVQLCHDAACADEYAGSPLRMPYDFHVVQTLLEARAARWEPQVVYQGSAPPDNAIVVTATGSGPGNGNDLAWSASANAPWLRVNTASGQGTANITVSYLTATLAQGRYDSIVELTSADGQRVQVPLSIDVQPPSTFWVSTQPPEFSAVNGHSIEEWVDNHCGSAPLLAASTSTFHSGDAGAPGL
ncbi:hypothetical protein [Aquabacterium sp.]|uniref:hypothetical protein n=1 Tax=Aquabacterium sp. TaxID=1872578 RepID=UPI003783DCA4